jgi:hypothetical protein
LYRVIACYELFAAVSGFFLLGRIISQGLGGISGILALVIATFALLAAVGGIFLWRDHPLGYRLSQVGEWIRLLRFGTPWVTYYAFLGLDFNVGLQLFTNGIPGIGADSTGGGIWLQWNVIAIAQFAFLQPPPFWGIGINLVSLLVLVALGTLVRWHRQTPGDTPALPDLSSLAV